MTIREMLLPEFDREMANARALLQRVPIAKADWKPFSDIGGNGV